MIDLSKYKKLILDFINGTVLVNEFEREYLSMVKEEKAVFPDAVSKIIQTLFSDTDAYCGNPGIANYDANNPFADIDENELRKRAAIALKELNKY